MLIVFFVRLDFEEEDKASEEGVADVASGHRRGMYSREGGSGSESESST